jgi:predicted metalloendopeptidase
MTKKSILGVLYLLASASCYGADTAPAPLTSGVDKQYFDPSVRVQDDLTRAVNGKWLDTVEIPPDQASWGSFDILYEETQNQLHDIAEDAVKTSSPSPQTRRVADFYTSFMDETTVEQRGLAPFNAELAKIDAIESLPDVYREIGHLETLQVGTPLEMSVGLDHRDATRYVVTIEQGGLGLPNRDYFIELKDKRFADVRRAYTRFVADLLNLAGDRQAAQLAPQVIAFESALAKIQLDNVVLRDPVKTYNKVAIDALPALSAKIDWTAYADAAEYGPKVSDVIIGEPSYIKALGLLIQKTPIPVLEAYLKLRFLDRFASVMPKAFVDAGFAFNSGVLNGVPQQRPRWKRALRLVNATIGDDLGQAYTAKYFPAERKARMEQLVGNLIATFHASINTLDWMGDQTKKEAQVKLSKLAVKIGYPSNPKDYSALEVKADDLGGNVLRAYHFEYQRNIKKLGSPVDRTEWYMTAQTVNAYFNPELNEIVFPAAILQPPFFNAAAEDAVNYGGAGAVIGHEISHGFDDDGAQYDGDGNLRDWWTKADHAAFLAKTKALISQYDAYSPLPGYHVKGALTLGENIADNSGLAIAYKAYRLSLSGADSPVIDGMTGDQRLYFGFAQIWRGKERDAAMVAQLKSDPHSPDYFRADGTVRNQPGFYQAFDVKPGDKEYLPPNRRVIMW